MDELLKSMTNNELLDVCKITITVMGLEPKNIFLLSQTHLCNDVSAKAILEILEHLDSKGFVLEETLI